MTAVVFMLVTGMRHGMSVGGVTAKGWVCSYPRGVVQALLLADREAVPTVAGMAPGRSVPVRCACSMQGDSKPGL